MISTNVEQSRRLMKVGIDSNTADMSWRYYALTYDFGHAMEVRTVNPFLYPYNAKEVDSVPAWSIGALWDIFHKNGLVFMYETSEHTSEELIESMVTRLEALKNTYSI